MSSFGGGNKFVVDNVAKVFLNVVSRLNCGVELNSVYSNVQLSSHGEGIEFN